MATAAAAREMAGRAAALAATDGTALASMMSDSSDLVVKIERAKLSPTRTSITVVALALALTHALQSARPTHCPADRRRSTHRSGISPVQETRLGECALGRLKSGQPSGIHPTQLQHATPRWREYAPCQHHLSSYHSELHSIAEAQVEVSLSIVVVWHPLPNVAEMQSSAPSWARLIPMAVKSTAWEAAPPLSPKLPS